MSRHDAWQRRAAELADAGLERITRTLTPTGPVSATLNGAPVRVLCSNDYLGFAHHPAVQAAAQGGGAGSSRLISGTRPLHAQLEATLGEAFGMEALLFTSGWQANQALAGVLCEAGELVASDALNHASIIDGLRLSKARKQVLPHAQPDAVPADAAAVWLETLYSMDGDIPDLSAYPRKPWLVLDEAHALGCLGPSGLGIAAQQGVSADVITGTFGKAFGAAGAFVAGPAPLLRLLRSLGRAFVYTTAPPEPVVAMALAGWQLAQRADAEREQLAARTAQLRNGLAQLGWHALGDAHIVPIVVGARAMQLSADLLAKGIFVPGIRWPTVARGAERLRFTLSAAHQPEDIDATLDALGPAPRGLA